MFEISYYHTLPVQFKAKTPAMFNLLQAMNVDYELDVLYITSDYSVFRCVF